MTKFWKSARFLTAVAMLTIVTSQEEEAPITELSFEVLPDVGAPNQGGIPFPNNVYEIENYLAQVEDSMWRRRLSVTEEQRPPTISNTTRRRMRRNACNYQGQTVYLEFPNHETFVTQIRKKEVVFDGYILSQEDQWEILANLQNQFNGFDVDFQLNQPNTGCEYSTLTFGHPTNEIWIRLVNGRTRFEFGSVASVDFLNRFKSDNAVINPHVWTWWYQAGIHFKGEGYDGEEYGRNLFYTWSKMDPAIPLQDAMREATIRTVSDTAAHELGHLLGLQHFDSFGSQNQNGGFVTFELEDGHIISSTADQSDSETWSHIMASDLYDGLPLYYRATRDRFFSERSAIKLLLAEQRNNGVFFSEDDAKERGGTIAAKKPGLLLKQMFVPNTILAGQFQGNRLATSAIVVQGAYMEGSDDPDKYRFRFDQDQFINIEVYACSRPQPFDDMVKLGITLHQENEDDGSLNPLYTSYLEFETLDPIIMDFQIPDSGNYVVEVFVRPVDCDAHGNCFHLDLDTYGLGQGYYDLLLYSIDRALGKA